MGAVIEFYENQKKHCYIPAGHHQEQAALSQAEFRKLKDAFHASWPESETMLKYIPFEPQIFDLLIIDEASQVSIAQAFPAFSAQKES